MRSTFVNTNANAYLNLPIHTTNSQSTLQWPRDLLRITQSGINNNTCSINFLGAWTPRKVEVGSCNADVGPNLQQLALVATAMAKAFPLHDVHAVSQVSYKARATSF